MGKQKQREDLTNAEKRLYAAFSSVRTLNMRDKKRTYACEVAREAGLGQGHVSRMLKSLANKGWIVKPSGTKGGLRLIEEVSSERV